MKISLAVVVPNRKALLHTEIYDVCADGIAKGNKEGHMQCNWSTYWKYTEIKQINQRIHELFNGMECMYKEHV